MARFFASRASVHGRGQVITQRRSQRVLIADLDLDLIQHRLDTRRRIRQKHVTQHPRLGIKLGHDTFDLTQGIAGLIDLARARSVFSTSAASSASRAFSIRSPAVSTASSAAAKSSGATVRSFSSCAWRSNPSNCRSSRS